MIKPLTQRLHGLAFMAMFGVVFGLALLGSPTPNFSSRAAAINVDVGNADSSLLASQQPTKQHNVDDCIICKNQTVVSGETHQQPRVDAFLASVPPRLFVPGAAQARAPPVLDLFVFSPPRSFNPRAPPSVS